MLLWGRQDTLEAGLLERGFAALPRYAGGPGMVQWWRSSEHRTDFPEQFVTVVDGLLLGDGAKS